MKKISVLPLILMVASSITATVMPEESNNFEHVNSADDGTMRSQSGAGGGGGVFSCVAGNTLNWSCHVTVPSLTNTNGSNFVPNVTVGNTSDSHAGTGHEGDTTSIPNA